jgi:hypothetical protein
MDWLQYYDRENYLFEVVSGRLRSHGSIGAFDLFTIVAWKAERAKGKIARRMICHYGEPDLEGAARQMTREIGETRGWAERLQVLTERWGFRLPMASAVLSVLYPEEFTVFDVRACKELGMTPSIPDRKWDGRLAGYQEFITKVREAVPEVASLRDADRILWSRSVGRQLQEDIENLFGQEEDEDPPP